MDKPTDQVEFESMLLSRHMTLNTARGRRLMERSAYILLSRIRAEGPMSIGQLSAAFGLDTSTLNRQTAAMQRSGFVTRIADPDGGIARKFQITDAGAKQLDDERALVISGLEKVLRDWTPDEVAVFAAALRRFNTDIERLDGRPWPR